MDSTRQPESNVKSKADPSMPAVSPDAEGGAAGIVAGVAGSDPPQLPATPPAFLILLDTGEARAVLAAYVATRLEELAQPRPQRRGFWRWVFRRPAPVAAPLPISARMQRVLDEVGTLQRTLTARLRAANRYNKQLIRYSTRRQSYELRRTTEEAKTAEQAARKAAAEAERRQYEASSVALSDDVQRKVVEDIEQRITAARWRLENDQAAAQARAATVAAQRAAEHRRAEQEAQRQALEWEQAQRAAAERRPREKQQAAAAAKQDAAAARRAEEATEATHRAELARIGAQQAEHEAAARAFTTPVVATPPPTPAPPVPDPRAEEVEQLAQEKHRTHVLQEHLEHAILEARIRGANDPEAARRRRAEREAAREARAPEHRTWVLNELGRKAQEEIAELKEHHGEQSEVVERAENVWNVILAKAAGAMEELAPAGGES